MALGDYLNTEYAIMDKVSVPDPMGGVMYEYQEGAHFFGADVLDTSSEMRIAQQSGAKAVYTLVVPKAIELDRGQIVRRMKNDTDFKITVPTRDMTTPMIAETQFSQATMERVTL